MLALAVTFTVAIYLLGPTLVARWILGFVVPRKLLVQSRGEEVTRSVIWAAAPLLLSLLWVKVTRSLFGKADIAELKTVLSGVYSSNYFDANRDAFFHSLHAFFFINLALLWRLYALVVTSALLFDFAILRFSFLRSKLHRPWQKALFATIVLPRVSEWHVLLSGMLVPSQNLSLEADVLTRSSGLYQGKIQDKILGANGGLESITLANPRRFLRDEYHKAKESNPEVGKKQFWRDIPGNLFVILGSDITNLNLRYVQELPLKFEALNTEREMLRRVLDRLSEPQAGHTEDD